MDNFPDFFLTTTTKKDSLLVLVGITLKQKHMFSLNHVSFIEQTNSAARN